MRGDSEKAAPTLEAADPRPDCMPPSVSRTPSYGREITLSPGEHSELIRAITEDFAPRFAPGSVLVYAGDTGDKWGYFDAALLAGLGVDVDSHGKMPDVVLHFTAKTGCCWLNLSPVMAPSMASDMPSLQSFLLDRLPAWPFLGHCSGLRRAECCPERCFPRKQCSLSAGAAGRDLVAVGSAFLHGVAPLARPFDRVAVLSRMKSGPPIRAAHRAVTAKAAAPRF